MVMKDKKQKNKEDVSVTQTAEGPMFERYLDETTIDNQSKSSFFDDDSSMDVGGDY